MRMLAIVLMKLGFEQLKVFQLQVTDVVFVCLFCFWHSCKKLRPIVELIRKCALAKKLETQVCDALACTRSLNLSPALDVVKMMVILLYFHAK